MDNNTKMCNKRIALARQLYAKEQRMHLTDKQIKKFINKIGKCTICGYDFIPTLQIHHIIPLSMYGTNENENLICVCPNCHKLLHYFYRLQKDFLLKDNESFFTIFLNYMNKYHFDLVTQDKILDIIEKYSRHIYGWYCDSSFINNNDEIIENIKKYYKKAKLQTNNKK